MAAMRLLPTPLKPHSVLMTVNCPREENGECLYFSRVSGGGGGSDVPLPQASDTDAPISEASGDETLQTTQVEGTPRVEQRDSKKESGLEEVTSGIVTAEYCDIP